MFLLLDHYCPFPSDRSPTAAVTYRHGQRHLNQRYRHRQQILIYPEGGQRGQGRQEGQICEGGQKEMSDHTRSKQRQHLAEDERRVYTRFYYRRFQDLWILKGKYVYLYKSFRKDILKGTSPLWVISFSFDRVPRQNP